MPTYEFRCPAGHDFERFYSKISDSVSETPCPECGAVAVRRISGGAGLLFKGSGFYITDYGKDGKKDQKPAAPKSGGGDAAKTGDAAGKGDVARKADGGTAGSTTTGTGSTSTGSGGTSGSGGSGGSGSSPSGGASGGSGPKPAGGA